MLDATGSHYSIRHEEYGLLNVAILRPDIFYSICRKESRDGQTRRMEAARADQAKHATVDGLCIITSLDDTTLFHFQLRAGRPDGSSAIPGLPRRHRHSSGEATSRCGCGGDSTEAAALIAKAWIGCASSPASATQRATLEVLNGPKEAK